MDNADNMPAEEAMIIEETEDLRQAAEQSQRENVLVELTLDNIIKWVSSSWQDVIGYFHTFSLTVVDMGLEAIQKMSSDIPFQKFLSAINMCLIKRRLLFSETMRIHFVFDSMSLWETHQSTTNRMNRECSSWMTNYLKHLKWRDKGSWYGMTILEIQHMYSAPTM